MSHFLSVNADLKYKILSVKCNVLRLLVVVLKEEVVQGKERKELRRMILDCCQEREYPSPHTPHGLGVLDE